MTGMPSMMGMNNNGMQQQQQQHNGMVQGDNMNMNMNPGMMNPGMRNMNSMNNMQMMNTMSGPGPMQSGMNPNMNNFNNGGMHNMQFNNSNNMGYNNMNQMNHMNMGRMNHMNGMGGMHGQMQMMQNMNPRMNMMGPMSSGMNSMSNMPIRAGGPSINMRMPHDSHHHSHSRMFGSQGRPSPYPSPQMYMAQKRHQSPMYNNQAMGPMPPNTGQYMSRGGFPGGPQGYPMAQVSQVGHPHNMASGPGPGFAGMPSAMRHNNMMPANTMQNINSMATNHQNFPLSSQQGGLGSINPAMRPGGPSQSMAGMAGAASSPGIFPARIKTELPNMSPRAGAGGPGGGGGGGGSAISSFQHSPVPGNPTPPLTPNASNNCISAPFASPVSDPGSTGSPCSSSNSQDVKPNFSIASK